jgi:hypothetical protein
MSFGFTFAAISLEVGSHVDHVAIAIFILVLVLAIVVINFFHLNCPFWCVNSEGLRQVRREHNLHGVDLGLSFTLNVI